MRIDSEKSVETKESSFIENLLLHAENRNDIFKIALRFGFVEINNDHPDFIIKGVSYKAVKIQNEDK